MPRYTVRLSSSTEAAEALYLPCTALDSNTAARIAARQLEFRRRFAFHGERWDTWTVLYSHLHGSEPKVMRTGRIGEQ